mmetsp:Transcript_142/g.517  ORF Transcript_142/g.517 Transcript_142/m.517 type:complete len:474 (+) Transcript_142:112-1533(+)|eukprot:CAMPEP_0117650252 /NCGR_PEP_ID=MMETSP0804-20121206/1441_1 /TAXON_ID=1074897 /ORGANISM="Tetraselmis astigmatica, Strain CCMP880" /LENGTH=473 /DNA_ID=CAMNT_0005456113 /DNA_START=103 /DNA_END=1524 /DNA_ORIENTATION=+
MTDYGSMYERVKDKPCKLGSLNVEGLKRTKEAVVERELAGLKDASTLEELKDVLLSATDALKNLDIFDVVEVQMHPGQRGDDKDILDTADINVELHESNMLQFHAGSYVNQSSEGSLEASLAVRNYFGRAEQIDASAEAGVHKSNSYSLAYSQPRWLGTHNQSQVRIFQAVTNEQRHSSFTETLRGGAFTVTSSDGQHKFSLDGGWQEIADRSCMASPQVRQQMGHRLRGSVKYVWSEQYMVEEPGVPDELSIQLGIKSETQIGVAPIGGAVGFAKQVLAGMVRLPTSETSDLMFAGKIGLLAPLGDKSGTRPSCITDRFFLGGVNSLRGFRPHGIGPIDERRRPESKGTKPDVANKGQSPGVPTSMDDALGGDLVCSFLAEYNFQLPHKVLEAFSIKGHMFVNAGNTILLGGGAMQEKLQELASTFRYTVGIGAFLPTPVGRFEMNYCKVLSSQPNDRPKHGLQFGFMTDIL